MTGTKATIQRRLGELADIRFSSVDKKSAEGEARVLLCNYTDVLANRRIDSSAGFMPATAAEQEIARFRLRAGDVVLTKDSETAEDIGYVALITRDLDAVLGYHLALLRPNGDSVLPEYLSWVLRAPQARRELTRQATGAVRAGLSLKALANLSLPVPPLDVQQQQAQVLDLVTDSIDLYRRLLVARRQYKRGLMQEMLAGQRRFREDYEDWESAPLGELVRIRSGHTPARGNHAFWGDNVPWITAKDMKCFFLGTATEALTEAGARTLRHLAQPGDVLLLVRGNLRGSVPVGLARQRLAFNQDVKLLQPHEGVLGEYIARYLEGLPQLLQPELTMTGHGLGRLDTDQLRSVVIRFPRLAVQRRICECIGAAERAIEVLEALATTVGQLERGLMQQLLSGEFIGADSAPANVGMTSV